MGQTFYLHNVLKIFPCYVIWNATCQTFFRKNCFDLLTPCMGGGCVQGQNICLNGVLCFIPINLICYMTTFRKEKKALTLWPHPRVNGVCKGKILLECYCVLIPFNLICNMTIFWWKYFSLCDRCGPVASFKQTWWRSTRWFYIPIIKALGLVVSNKKSFHIFHIYKSKWNIWDEAMFGPRGIIWTNLVEVH